MGETRVLGKCKIYLWVWNVQTSKDTTSTT